MLLYVFITFISSFYLAQTQITNNSLSTYVVKNLRTAIPNANLTNPKCALDIVDTLDAAARGELWAVKLLDASSKVQSGFALGNIVNLGSFEECMGVQYKNDTEIHGKYCLFALLLHVTKKEIVPPLVTNINLVKKHIGNRSLGLPLIEAMCIPNSCTTQDMYEMYEVSGLKKNFPYVEPVFVEEYCQPEKNFVQFSYLEWFAVFMFMITIILLLFCTAYDLYLVRNIKKPLHELFVTFSLYSNIKKLTKIKKDVDQIPCINGIRFISMMWIVLGHRYMFGAIFPNVNYLDMDEILVWYIIIYIDSFV
ncbi:uncharacterized protein CBL_01293 [Carabus blaptoides fortunei]